MKNQFALLFAVAFSEGTAVKTGNGSIVRR